ncbi:hypothetical protein C8R41DRAFT_862709 [Lentinula lateritia]|uniref:Uncharacterized protein n=1 Tax=Lentinula lateritia TaxID=40482 RepID=A0ABQ8VXI9_9AGAR|nr:hypothetical protein C8R41DRAFT_862709 [Lentinula lateritia]
MVNADRRSDTTGGMKRLDEPANWTVCGPRDRKIAPETVEGELVRFLIPQKEWEDAPPHQHDHPSEEPNQKNRQGGDEEPAPPYGNLEPQHPDSPQQDVYACGRGPRELPQRIQLNQGDSGVRTGLDLRCNIPPLLRRESETAKRASRPRTQGFLSSQLLQRARWGTTEQFASFLPLIQKEQGSPAAASNGQRGSSTIYLANDTPTPKTERNRANCPRGGSSRVLASSSIAASAVISVEWGGDGEDTGGGTGLGAPVAALEEGRLIVDRV